MLLEGENQSDILFVCPARIFTLVMQNHNQCKCLRWLIETAFEVLSCKNGPDTLVTRNQIEVPDFCKFSSVHAAS